MNEEVKETKGIEENPKRSLFNSFLHHFKTKKHVSILTILVILAAIPITVISAQSQLRTVQEAATLYDCGRCSNTRIGCFVTWKDSTSSCSRTDIFQNTQYFCNDPRCITPTPTIVIPPASTPTILPSRPPTIPPTILPTKTPTPTRTPTPTAPSANSYDVIIYGNNISGAGIIRAINQADRSSSKMKVAFIGTASYQQGPVSNGLSLEDMYDGNINATGFYKQFRDNVISTYSSRGINCLNNGRLSYEPEVAQSIIKSYTTASNVTYFSAHVLSGSDAPGNQYLTIKDETRGTITLRTKYFIDASPEGDLARMLGASYRVGEKESIYNDKLGIKPPLPSASNNYDGPDALSELLTLKIYPTNTKAPAVTSRSWPWYSPSTYNANDFRNKINLTTFKNSWSMITAKLPNSKRELNEAWTDHMSPIDSYKWFFGTSEDRGRIRQATINRAINAVRYLQENGYGYVGISNVNPWPYVRGNLRIEGKTVYKGTDVANGIKYESVATGFYSQFDQHDPYTGPVNYGTAYVNVPMGSMMPKDHPYLLVSTAVSSDFMGSESSVRMESTRANMGYAAGVMAVIAKEKGFIPIQSMNYDEVRLRLQGLGQRTTAP